MAIVDNAFREWIADFKAINPDFAENRQIIDTAQYAFAAGRKAQRDIDDARQPVGQEPVAVVDGPDRGGAISQTATLIRPMVSGANLYAAPPAQAVDLDAARREGHDCAIRYVLGYLNGTGDLASTQYGEILNGCGRESIIRSAIRDGELEFTGLGRWVAKYGTDAERALIDSQAVG